MQRHQYIVNALGSTECYRVVVSGNTSDGFLYELCEVAQCDGKFIITQRLFKAYSLKNLRNILEQMINATNEPLMSDPLPFLEPIPKESFLYKED